MAAIFTVIIIYLKTALLFVSIIINRMIGFTAVG